MRLFLTEQVIEPCPYLTECVFGQRQNIKAGQVMLSALLVTANGINQKFHLSWFVRRPTAAERVIRTIMEMWHEKQSFDSPEHRVRAADL